jgi:hypothetical protein
MKIRNTEKDELERKLLTSLPGGIEAQEAQGQKELVSSSQLPVKVNYPHGSEIKEICEKLNIEIMEDLDSDDDLFMSVILPKGWIKRGTNHSMWSELLDDKGNVRATIFYKAAFYDREAFINFNRKISHFVNREGFCNDDYSYNEKGIYNSYSTPFIGMIKTNKGEVLFKTKSYELPIEYEDYDGTRRYSERYKFISNIIKKVLLKECLGFLKENYPEWESIYSYWDL